MYRTKAIICASIVFPTAMLASSLVGAVLKSTNPSNVDITHGLAYLGHILITAAIVALSLIVLSLIYSLKARNTEGARAARLPLAILVTNVIIVILLLGINAYTNKVQDRYLTERGIPTLKQNFEALKKNSN